MPEEVNVPAKLESVLSAADAHEHRLQRLEDEVSDLKAQGAEVGANLKYLGAQLTTETGRILDRIDTSLAPLSEKLQEHMETDARVYEQLGGVVKIVDKIEERAQSRKARWASFKKILAPITTGAAAIFLKELVMFLVKHLS